MVRRVRFCAAPLIAACAVVFAAGLPGQALADGALAALAEAAERLWLPPVGTTVDSLWLAG